jgi:diguanylate cyclase (GGDEF)-like protein
MAILMAMLRPLVPRSVSLKYSIPAILLLAGAVMGGLTFHRETVVASNRAQQDLIQQANFTGNQTAQLVEYLYRQSRGADVPLWFSQLVTAPYVTRAILFDEQDRVIESTQLALRQERLFNIVAADELAQIQQLRQTQSSRTLISSDGNHLYAVHPVGLEAPASQMLPSRVGILLIEYNLQAQKHQLFLSVFQHSLIHIACLAGSSLLLWLFFANVVVKPLRQLTAAAIQISAGDLSTQAKINSSNEIGVLAQSFDQMVEQLRASFLALEATNAVLEQRVNERTAALAAANRKLQRLANIDGLTQIANRRRFDEFMTQVWQQLQREQQPLSLLLCDVDYFKHYNDIYGHQQGDECLRQIAQALLQTVRRPTDLVARYGGEEFAVILPNTGLAGAVAVAELLGEAIQALELPHRGSKIGEYVTLSVGVSTLVPAPDLTLTALIMAADTALYEAKQRGRNQTIAHAA